jgi:hypothetical protein
MEFTPAATQGFKQTGPSRDFEVAAQFSQEFLIAASKAGEASVAAVFFQVDR